MKACLSIQWSLSCIAERALTLSLTSLKSGESVITFPVLKVLVNQLNYSH